MGPRLTCARCRKSIGVYEPLLILERDGAVQRSCYLDLRDAPDGSLDGCALVHAACLPAALPRPLSAGLGV
jgi:hypothetical protein